MRWAVCYFKNIHKLDSSSNNISRNQYTYLKVDCVWKHLICQHQVVIGKLLNKISKMWSNLSPFSSFTLINRNMIQCIFFLPSCCYLFIYLLFFVLFCCFFVCVFISFCLLLFVGLFRHLSISWQQNTVTVHSYKNVVQLRMANGIHLVVIRL